MAKTVTLKRRLSGRTTVLKALRLVSEAQKNTFHLSTEAALSGS